MDNKENYNEKKAFAVNGWIMLPVLIVLIAVGAILLVNASTADITLPNGGMTAGGAICIVLAIICLTGFRILTPNEAYVFALFGKYYGSLKTEGFYWVVPFVTAVNPSVAVAGQSKKLSLKAMTLDNGKQKVNDAEGNPIEIGVVVIWRINDTAKAVFQVDNYKNFISVQTDAAIRNIARQYPYDLSEEGDEKSLRGSSQEIANMLCIDLQERVKVAGIEVVEARISHLAYSQEIAAAMLQRQQAKAIVDARTKIVEGAVGMVELALDKLNASGCVELDNEKKAQMVSNLMVVLCANKDTQPVVNSSTLG